MEFCIYNSDVEGRWLKTLDERLISRETMNSELRETEFKQIPLSFPISLSKHTICTHLHIPSVPHIEPCILWRHLQSAEKV
jgi:hypothetical protein